MDGLELAALPGPPGEGEDGAGAALLRPLAVAAARAAHQPPHPPALHRAQLPDHPDTVIVDKILSKG